MALVMFLVTVWVPMVIISTSHKILMINRLLLTVNVIIIVAFPFIDEDTETQRAKLPAPDQPAPQRWSQDSHSSHWHGGPRSFLWIKSLPGIKEGVETDNLRSLMI